MEIKKTPESDLEKGRLTFFLMGFAVVLSGFFVLLEWRSSETDSSSWTAFGPVFIENEFDGGNQTEKSVTADLPKKYEQETVYEDYVVTDEIAVVEKPEDKAVALSNPESDETLLLRNKEAIAPAETVTDKVAVSADTMPQFPGGQTALVRFIYANIQYPPAAIKQRIEGRVWCSFVVETDGSISNVRLEEGVYVFLDEEAVRVLKKMPAWLPGRTKGENIRVKVYIPVVFKR